MLSKRTSPFVSFVADINVAYVLLEGIGNVRGTHLKIFRFEQQAAPR